MTPSGACCFFFPQSLREWMNNDHGVATLGERAMTKMLQRLGWQPHNPFSSSPHTPPSDHWGTEMLPRKRG